MFLLMKRFFDDGEYWANKMTANKRHRKVKIWSRYLLTKLNILNPKSRKKEKVKW